MVVFGRFKGKGKGLFIVALGGLGGDTSRALSCGLF